MIKTCKNYAARIHQEEEYTVSVLILMPKGESKSAVNAANGMFRAMTGLMMKTLDSQIQKFLNIRHNL